nr:LytS/YhcK type 5TM receptor domain-containing protein [Ammoniphilus sp. YIM 78166]
MYDLLIVMLERMGIIVTVAFVMTRFAFFRQTMNRQQVTRSREGVVMLMFGFFGIIGTYTGVAFNPALGEFSGWSVALDEEEALANSRVIGVVAAGLLGGYRVGLGAGLIAGIHRFLLGGFTNVACGGAALLAGWLAGWFHHKMPGRRLELPTAFAVGALAEAIQMLVILLVARPFTEAWLLVQSIGLPMILANGVGCSLFILIIRNVLNEEERAGAIQAQKALRLASLTLQHMRKGLTADSARATCELVHNEVGVKAVAMTDGEVILAHVGAERERERERIGAAEIRRVLEAGELAVVQAPSAVIAPLKRKEETIGTIIFYFREGKEVSFLAMELIKGLSTLLSHQLEIAEADRYHKLAKEAEIKSLQAQISPHFLFNALNVIVSLIRTDPMKARKLLVSLSHFFRQNLTGTTTSWTTIEAELNQVKAYLNIEEARFVDKLRVSYEVDEEVLHYEIPPLTLQPIVENAIKHGIHGMEKDCEIVIRVEKGKDGARVSVQDNGQGMGSERLQKLGKEQLASAEGTGIGLYNTNRRLTMMLGEESAIQVESHLGQGTLVYFNVPKFKKEGSTDEKTYQSANYR